MSQICGNADYPQISYRQIMDDSINDGLDGLTRHGGIDLMVMVHENHNLWRRIFEGSHTQEMARNVDVPLMVYPSGYYPMF